VLPGRRLLRCGLLPGRQLLPRRRLLREHGHGYQDRCQAVLLPGRGGRWRLLLRRVLPERRLLPRWSLLRGRDRLKQSLSEGVIEVVGIGQRAVRTGRRAVRSALARGCHATYSLTVNCDTKVWP